MLLSSALRNALLSLPNSKVDNRREVCPPGSQNMIPAYKFTATAPQSANMTKESPQFFPNHNSERVKIRYGPFTVPEMSVNNAMKDFTVPVAEKPCTDCLVTWIQAGLEYPNGTVANANNGLWLHHTVFSNTQRTSIICPQGGGGDQFFASGNERTPIDLCVNG